MKYRLLGKSGLRVSELALGTMTFGDDWGWGATYAESRRMFDLYANAGGNFIDTANRYTNGTSEKYVGEFIASDRHHFVLATKYTLFTRYGDPNFAGNHRKNMVRAVEESLTRLKTDYIDVYWLHAWDGTTPIDEIMRALDDLVRAGKVLHIGVSDTPAWVVARGNTLAELHGWTPFTALQLRYSLLDRSAERDLLPMAKFFGMAVTPWAVLGAGILTGKYNQSTDASGRANMRKSVDEGKLAIAQAAIDVANELGTTPTAVAIAWVRSREETMVPIIGARTAEQLGVSLDAVSVILSEEHRQRLNDAAAFDPGFPHEFLASDGIQNLMFGGPKDDIVM